MKINGVYTPSDKQKEKGIGGTVNLSIVDDNDRVLTQLNGIMIRQSKEGNRFLAAPGYSIADDPQTGQKRYRNHFKLFPLSDNEQDNATQKERMASLTAEVTKILDAGGTPKSSDNTTAPSKPATTTSQAW